MIATILAKEGGYVNHSADRGGPTNFGITAMSYAEYFKCHKDAVTADMIKAIPKMLAEKIYYTLYYVRPNIVSLHPIVQPIIFDMAVNHGRRGAVKILQTTLGSLGYPGINIDGMIGKKTIDTTAQAVKELGNHLISSLVDSRIDYYKNIIETDPSQAVFEDGWIARAESFRPSLTAQNPVLVG